MNNFHENVVRAASESLEALADEIFCALSAGVGDPTNEPLAAELARVLIGINEPPLPARLRSALAYGANTWRVPAEHDTLSAGLALLFKTFPSPNLSIALARRLLRDVDPQSGLSVNSRYIDLLLRCVLSQALDPTVKNRCIEIMHDDRFSRFIISMFLSLVKIDTTLVPLVAGRVFAQAAAARHIDGRPGYMIAFDRELTLSDVDSIIRSLEPRSISRFAELFLSFSRRFARTNSGVSESSSIRKDDIGELSDQVLVLEDRNGGMIRPSSQAAMVTGLLKGLRLNKKEFIARMARLGLQSRPMLQPSSVS